MPIKISGPISMQDIVNEFGGDAPHNLDEYYRGGSRVPNANINVNVPSTGAIAVGDFYGASKVIYFTIEMFGGGGAGGNGYEDGGDPNTRPGDGQPTGILLKSNFDNGVFNFITSASGGNAGLHGTLGATAGGDGAIGSFGTGGNAGGALNTAAPAADFSKFGSGGGGGGGDQGSSGGSFFGIISYGGGDNSGKAGAGGSSGSTNLQTIEIDTGVEYVLMVGAGGDQQSGFGNHLGANGVPGYLRYKVSTDGNTNEWTQVIEPLRVNNNAADYTMRRAYLFKLNDSGEPLAPQFIS
jgi:hypothetical protein